MRGATFYRTVTIKNAYISIHAPHAGSDIYSWDTSLSGATISIHAPHAGSDRIVTVKRVYPGNFNPRSPCGERHTEDKANPHGVTFQSTLPMRGATILPAIWLR